MIARRVQGSGRLLGQNVNSYGKGLKSGIGFAGSCLRRHKRAAGGFQNTLYDLRTLRTAPMSLLIRYATVKRSGRHLHLPFQSGSDRILKRMNRRYGREKYLELVNYAKERIPGLSLTSDITVGFPGETYGDFCDTVESLSREVKFSSLFTFIYSPREGTPAAAMEDPVTRARKGQMVCRAFWRRRRK